MRKLDELTAADFPNLDAAKFEQWKQARSQANRNAGYILLGLVVINVVLYLATGSFFLGGMLLLIVMIVNERKPARLWKELGMTRQALKEARMRAAPPPEISAEQEVSEREPVSTGTRN